VGHKSKLTMVYYNIFVVSGRPTYFLMYACKEIQQYQIRNNDQYLEKVEES